MTQFRYYFSCKNIRNKPQPLVPNLAFKAKTESSYSEILGLFLKYVRTLPEASEFEHFDQIFQESDDQNAIKSKFDFSIIEDRLKKKRYSKLESFKNEFDTIFDNVFTFKNKCDPIYCKASLIKTQADRIWKIYFQPSDKEPLSKIQSSISSSISSIREIEKSFVKFPGRPKIKNKNLSKKKADRPVKNNDEEDLDDLNISDETLMLTQKYELAKSIDLLKTQELFFPILRYLNKDPYVKKNYQNLYNIEPYQKIEIPFDSLENHTLQTINAYISQKSENLINPLKQSHLKEKVDVILKKINDRLDEINDQLNGNQVQDQSTTESDKSDEGSSSESSNID